MVSDLTILKLQFGASLFMAFDYFFNSRQRRKVNKLVQTWLLPVQSLAGNGIKGVVTEIRQQTVLIALGSLLLIAGFMIFPYLAAFAVSWPAWLSMIVIVLVTFTMIFVIHQLSHMSIVWALKFIISLGLGAVATFLIRCPKGTVFGIGFVLLMISFGCRYSNLHG